jgi:hypothetical protein
MNDAAPKSYQPINFAQKYGLFAEQWQPKVVAELNDYQFKLVRIEGDFVWHDHPTPTKLSSCSKASCASIFAMVQ